MGLCLIVGSAYHKNTNAKVERANLNGVINAASTLGDGLTPFFIDRGAHPRLPLTAPAAGRPDGESPALY